MAHLRTDQEAGLVVWEERALQLQLCVSQLNARYARRHVLELISASASSLPFISAGVDEEDEACSELS
jgi:hypothetical protein